MTVPKEPILAAVFVLYFIACLLSKPIAQRLSGRPEWIAIVIGSVLMAFSLSNQTDKNRDQLAYPGATLLVTAGVRLLALAVFWSGLAISAYTKSNFNYWGGLVFASSGIVLSWRHVIVMYRRLQ